MTLSIKILNGALILFALYISLKQGSAMIMGKPELVAMFNKWNIGKGGMVVLGMFTLLSAALVLFPKTFVWGNFITASGILLIIALHLLEKDLKSFLTEMPFF